MRRKVNAKHAWQPRQQILEKLWNEKAQDPKPKMLQSLRIAADGGLTPQEIEKMFLAGYAMRWIYAVQLVSFVIINCIYVYTQDIELLINKFQHDDPKGDKFLISRAFMQKVDGASKHLSQGWLGNLLPDGFTTGVHKVVHRIAPGGG